MKWELSSDTSIHEGICICEQFETILLMNIVFICLTYMIVLSPFILI
jgi:hypothetical protein